jgi:predicted enzyme related to lactoylglutathione lyase
VGRTNDISAETMKTSLDQICINVSDHEGAIDHGNALWKLYLDTDDCAGLYQRAIEAGAQAVTPPQRLEQWPVTVAFIRDPDGYQIEIIEQHAS